MEISVVVPVYRSERSLPDLVAEVREQLNTIANGWEIILVDDGSPDQSARVIESLCGEDRRVKGLLLARNHGQHYATLCGIKEAQGLKIITMDDDLQHPPDEIPKLLNAVDNGCHIAIGAPETVKQNFFRRLTSTLMQFLLQRLLHKPEELRLASFRCMSRKAADLISQYEGIYPYLPVLMFNAVPLREIKNVTVRHAERKFGNSSYSLAQLFKLSTFLLINHSRFLLRATVFLGLALAILAGLMTIYFVARYLIHHSAPLGWTSLAVLTTFFSGMILVSLGIIGEYIGRIVSQSDKTPTYQIYKRVN